MATSPQFRGAPEHVIVVGAGMVGLSTAWFLQQRGVQVTVLERSAVAAGASWGNAGWITPAMAIPLAEPAVLRYGMKAVLDPSAPLHVPVRVDPQLWSFLLRFAARCTAPTWRRTMAALLPLNVHALDAYDELETDPGLTERLRSGPIIAAFREDEHADGLLTEFDQIREAGMALEASDITAEQVRELAPVVAPNVSRAIRIDGQRFMDPGAYVAALATAVRARGGEVREGADVRGLRHGPGGISVDLVGAAPVRADAVVLATGAWLPTLAKQYGVRTSLRAGRGYSFSVSQPVDGRQVSNPIYFPYERIVCTPLGQTGRIRMGGTMEFRPTDDPLYPARIDSIVANARPLVQGLDLNDRQDQWVGARPVTVDGLPLVGPTKAPGVWAHGGHGMWGMCQGPATARLLAEQMTTGTTPAALRPLAPTR
ncbi:FAD-dependent oxidoreductase [Ornithinimicrobium ciconiae]|uniref:FAD-dependent oxidoreductase n=1 Tax=Ornithinimicrobium ciconiae TaxID=2594265 RepID=A0A516GEK7_9MICO|nr:FAD-dependent oxidoreductase [Ornithinimicrobium ciconiae]QDO89962.1 FAD-dependent oxidoreductase [Ornithinimicrobium ciconiae]